MAEAIRSAFGSWKHQVDAAASGGPSFSYPELIDGYLNEAHHNNPGTGCVFSALAGEIARSDKHTRALASEQIRDNIQLITDLLRIKNKKTARARAILTYSSLVGAMSLARAASDEALSFEILRTVAELLKHSVLKL
jgi:TetR/AcrR family transcriptional regulator, transcriptional repressor for nem operon